MKQNLTRIILAVVIVIFTGLVGYLALSPVPKIETPLVTQVSSPTIQEVELTNEIALSLLKNYLPLPNGKCLPEGVVEQYNSCVINISKENNQWVVTVTIDGLSDDSVRAMRIITNVIYQNGQWLRGEASRSQKCQPNRGHQYFSDKLCI